jgi:hypothetical protein
MYYKTAIVYNDPSKIIGLSPFYYRYRSCDTNLTANTPANRYQRQKIIQNTVRVYASLYTANKGPLAAYKRPGQETHGVCWNQMSDRPLPSVQRATVPTGVYSSLNSRHHSVTSIRPGCQTPGGVGCDIKHNSYDRYLNRLKAKGPLRRGSVPKDFVAPQLPFNRAYPIYGAKLFKQNIVAGCNCPIDESNSDTNLFNDPLYQIQSDMVIGYQIGQYVYAHKVGSETFLKALVIHINDDGTYNVKFNDSTVRDYVHVSELTIYFPCKCDTADENATILA